MGGTENERETEMLMRRGREVCSHDCRCGTPVAEVGVWVCLTHQTCDSGCAGRFELPNCQPEKLFHPMEAPGRWWKRRGW